MRILFLNVRTFYTYINSRIPHRDTISALENNDDQLCDDSDKARSFNVYVASVADIDDGNRLNYVMPATCFSINNVMFISTNVKAAINKLKSNLFSGPYSPSTLFQET